MSNNEIQKTQEPQTIPDDALEIIIKTFDCSKEDVKDIYALEKGMTNSSFVFNVNSEKYIIRVPGKGTRQLINRKQEEQVYKVISNYDLCYNPIYINAQNGYKITKFIEGIRPCNPTDTADLMRCMDKLRYFHSLHLEVSHTFDVFKQIDFYESLRGNTPSLYCDYENTKKNVLSLKNYIDNSQKNICLCHIDSVPDNFLFYTDSSGEEKLQLTDWEYAGMQDSHIDIAMFCVYSMYTKEQCDRLIDIYFKGNCDTATRAKIYCYICVCGLLWSNWCEYKHILGIDFGEYSLKQYEFAKEFYRHAMNIISQENICQ